MSKSSEDYLQVLHLGDPAHTATLLARAANETGRAWRVLPLAQNPQTASPVAQTLGRAWRGAWWEARLWGAKLSRPRIHLHSAMALPHVGWALGDYVLHLHGTDIRSRRYEPAYTNRIHDAVAHARQVFYSTPDLREHLTDWRPEARLIPVPVDLDCPTAINPYRCKARSTGSYVFFVSRWEAVKGGNTQVEAAKCLRARLPQSVALVGLQWGDSQLMDAAREAGVCLIPKLPGAQYRQVIRDAAACVGQTAGILSASELEALAEDVPLIAPLNPSWYDASHPSLVDVPVWGGTALDPMDSETIAKLTLAALQTPVSQRPLTRAWVQRFHSPTAALAGVLEGYRAAGW